MVTIPSDEYDELHRLRVEVRLFREGIATLQRELEQERKRSQEIRLRFDAIWQYLCIDCKYAAEINEDAAIAQAEGGRE
jgi:hypothetical protein